MQRSRGWIGGGSAASAAGCKNSFAPIFAEGPHKNLPGRFALFPVVDQKGRASLERLLQLRKAEKADADNVVFCSRSSLAVIVEHLQPKQMLMLYSRITKPLVSVYLIIHPSLKLSVGQLTSIFPMIIFDFDT